MAINYNYNFAQLARDSGFKLRQYRDGPLDWRLIGCLEVERILREQSLEQIDGVLNHLSEVPLGSILDTNILDSGIAKYFVLAQFSIQYLLFCRTFLDETVRDLRESLIESETKVAGLQKSVEEAKNEVLQLNKKITQIEAIHEVIYPCHMCTKNFVSNEALNLHISRKHAVGRVTERRNDTPISGTTAHHEKDNDRNLINTIKLELEIKQLKERLNLAEKDIKERNAIADLQHTSTHTTSTTTTTEKVACKDVGIQGNLIEEKEKDDTILSEENELNKAIQMESKEQLVKLHTKLQEFEDWQNVQKKSIEHGMTKINQKLADIEVVLGHSQKQREKELQSEQRNQHVSENLECTLSPSLEQLEKVLSDRLSEISKTSAEKLEEIVHHMEQNYNEKLNKLGKELKLRADLDSRNQAVKIINPVVARVLNETTREIGQISLDLERQHDATYDISSIKEVSADDNEEVKAGEETNTNLLVSLSSASNGTFVKANCSAGSFKGPERALQLIGNAEDSSATDVSESLSDDETEASAAIPFRKESTNTIKQKTTLGYDKRISASERMEIMPKKENRQVTLQPRKSTSPMRTQERIYFQTREFTRGDARKMSSHMLTSLGFESKTKTLSRASYKKANAELMEQRSYLKKKYPEFTAARNKVRKFVEKLCSAKLPENARVMLQQTQPLRPIGVQQQRPRATQDESFDSELDMEQVPSYSTPLKKEPTSHATEFTERLERLLNTPKYHTSEHVTELRQPPVPVPRKRVMFNTLPVGGERNTDENIK